VRMCPKTLWYKILRTRKSAGLDGSEHFYSFFTAFIRRRQMCTKTLWCKILRTRKSAGLDGSLKNYNDDSFFHGGKNFIDISKESAT
jgi:hypothetical protein